MCDQLTEEQMELKKKRRELEAELTIICRKEKHAQRYLSQKPSSESAETSTSTSPLSRRSSSINSVEDYYGGSSSEAETSREPSIPPDEPSF